MPIRPKAVTRLFQKLTGHAGEPDERPLFSVVLLRTTESELPEEVIQAAALRAFVDMVEQHGEGAVLALQSGRMTVVRAGEDMMQVIQDPEPYVANNLGQRAFPEHRAWLSIDYLSGRKRVEKNRVYIYRRLAAFAAELIGSDTPAVYFVQERTLILCTEQTKEKLEYFDSLEDLFL